MIPVRLTLRDFLSYADPAPIDFTGFDVACLSGENGAGKSALLDAMCWAMFGAARGAEGGQNQDRLIRDGAEEAMVDFEFKLQEAAYRIVRRRTRAGKGEVRFMVGRDDGDWRNIAGETLRDTEGRIAQTVRMDYKTFTASAFFIQNRAEDFLARMKPEERKEVFARLLDLGVYERLEEAARLKAREATVRRTEHARRAEELASRCDDLDALTTALETCTAEAAAAQTELADAVAMVDRLRSIVGTLEQTEARYSAERRAAEDLGKSIEQLQRIRDGRTTELSTLDKLLARAAELQEAEREKDALTNAEALYREAQERAAALGAQRLAVLEQIEAERRVIAARLDERRRQVDAMTRRTQELEAWRAKLQRLEAELAGSEDPLPAIGQLRAVGEEQRAAEARLGEELRTIDTQLADLEERRSILGRGEGECPVCGSVLDDDHRKQVEKLLRTQSGALTVRRQAARAERETARKEIARCAEEVKRLERTRSEREKVISDREAMLARLEPAPAIEKELAALRAAAQEDSAVLDDRRFALELRATLRELDDQLDGLYDADGHAKVRKRLSELDATLGPLAGRLESARARHPVARAELVEATRRLVDAESALSARTATLEALGTELERLDAARRDRDVAERAVEERRRRATTAERELARLGERVETAKQTAADREAAAEAERAAATEHRRYTRLVEAFGRGGIPDLIIDNARPDLEQEANQILGRLSDWEMSVHFAMQRGTRSGRAKETFDVLVHHDGGLRDYAMFSGGEAFRIAFAVRLALSKLLVRRAGARLETLVIDEGFGTQDPAGRERLVEAIDLARAEFSKVLVITHLDDLKDAFGTQIQVTKDPGRGSQVRVVPA